MLFIHLRHSKHLEPRISCSIATRHISNVRLNIRAQKQLPIIAFFSNHSISSKQAKLTMNEDNWPHFHQSTAGTATAQIAKQMSTTVNRQSGEIWDRRPPVAKACSPVPDKTSLVEVSAKEENGR